MPLLSRSHGPCKGASASRVGWGGGALPPAQCEWDAGCARVAHGTARHAHKNASMSVEHALAHHYLFSVCPAPPF